MSDLFRLANDAQMRAAMDGFKIEVFFVTVADWNKATDDHSVKDPTCTENKLMGVPVELFPRIMDCTDRSVELALKGRVGWILNPDPFSKIEMKPAFDAEDFEP